MNTNLKMHLLGCISAVLVAGCAHAQEAPAPQSESAPLLAHYSFATDDAAGVVVAFDAVMASCGAGIPARVSILDDMFNGADPGTHTVIFAHPGPDEMMKTGETFRSCPAAMAFGETISRLTEPGADFLGELVVSGGELAADNAFMVFQMTVSDEATYAKAFSAFMEQSQASGSLSGSYGLVRVLAGGGSTMSHYAYFGASDLKALLSSVRLLSPEVSASRRAFNKTVSGTRSVQGSSMSVRVKDYAPPSN